MAQTYPPLIFLDQSPTPGNEFEWIKQQFKNAGVRYTDRFTKESYIDFMLSFDFLNPEYTGLYRDVNEVLFLNTESMLRKTKTTLEDIKSNRVMLTAEWQDLYLAPVLWQEWAKYKQVLKPDEDFAKALIQTEQFALTKNMIEHLPYQYFYVDLLDCKDFDPFVGVFVSVHPQPDRVHFCIYLLTKDYLTFSFYTGGTYDENGQIQFKLTSIANKLNADYNISGMDRLKHQELDMNYDRLHMSMLVLQLICYITSKEPEIDESPQTKGTYKPSTVVRNKFSEVQMWDVGVRYGKSYRAKIKELKEQEENAQREYKASGNPRKPMTPHFRSAHWHKYWTGKGRTICQVKWIEPCFVGMKENQKTNQKAKDVVIHTVG